ncbi:MAG: response regulator [Alphaproteobacteria bacterium]|nr:response regulator [Alphaproteobacteria bacterium]
MTNNNAITVLIAEDNDVSREMMAGILETKGYTIIHARDGGSAIEKIHEHKIDVALVDINMAPKGGFEFVKHLVVKDIKLPVAVVTGIDTSDVLMEANALGVLQVIHKPITPERLIQSVQRMAKSIGLNPEPMGVKSVSTLFSHEELMQKAIEIAEKNVQLGRGGPYGAILADAKGKILGQGANGIKSRIDPMAHAEVMAIRQAAERLGATELKDCTIYCSSQPTKIGQALIESVGIGKIYYGLSNEDVAAIRGTAKTSAPICEQICKDEALAMFKAAKRPE